MNEGYINNTSESKKTTDLSPLYVKMLIFIAAAYLTDNAVDIMDSNYEDYWIPLVTLLIGFIVSKHTNNINFIVFTSIVVSYIINVYMIDSYQ